MSLRMTNIHVQLESLAIYHHVAVRALNLSGSLSHYVTHPLYRLQHHQMLLILSLLHPHAAAGHHHI
jgi:hypothetical protein